MPTAHIDSMGGLKILRLHSLGSTLPHLWSTGSQFGPLFHYDLVLLLTPLRHYSQVWQWIPQSGIQWDFNSLDERAATHALWYLLTTHDKSCFNLNSNWSHHVHEASHDKTIHFHSINLHLLHWYICGVNWTSLCSPDSSHNPMPDDVRVPLGRNFASSFLLVVRLAVDPPALG